MHLLVKLYNLKVSAFFLGGIMNNFYGILKIKNISKVKFDYYNKCKMSFDIICMDEKVTLKLICMENMIDRI